VVARVGDLPPTHARRLALHRGILDGAHGEQARMGAVPRTRCGYAAPARYVSSSWPGSTLGSRSKSA
jgi:hypothetical protein